MVGQEHVMKALINALDHNRLHHAYLFTGTRGVGKTSIARILAKCLNCEVGVSSEPCGDCGSCREIAEGRFVDLIEVDAASRTRVEDTRELLDNVQYAPTRGRYKIYLIDEVHMLSNHSFNALLKTLEEPPEHVKFLLATTDPQKLPVTILSRCLQFNLKNMSPERIVQHLQHVLQQEMIPHEEAAIWQLARSADGSMRDALSLTDQAIAFGSGKIVDADVTSMLGSIDHRFIERLIAALSRADAADLLAAVADFAEQSPDYHAALGDLISLLHRVAIAQALPEALDNSYGDREQIMRFAHDLAAEDVQLFYQTALIGRRDLHLAPDARGGFEMTLLRMLIFKPQGVADVPTQPLSSRSGSGNPPAPRADSSVQGSSAPPAANRAPESVDPQLEEKPIAPVAEQRERDIQTPPEAAPAAKKPDPSKALLSQLEEQEGALTSVAGLTDESASAELKEVNSAAEPDLRDRKPSVAKDIQSLKPQDWLVLYDALAVRGVLQSTVANCILLGREGTTLFFALDESKASLFDESHGQRLSDLLSDYFGETVKADIQLQRLGQDMLTPALDLERRKELARRNAVDKLQSDPVMQVLQRELSANLDIESVTFAVKPSEAL